jgi:hypothetical protein
MSILSVSLIWGKSTKLNKDRANESTLNVDIFLDEACTMKAKSINWGEVTPGGNSTIQIFIKNRSKNPVTLFSSLSNPTLDSEYLFLNWNREGYQLKARKTISAYLTLSVSESAPITSFNVDVVITGTAI